jgi:hypothetical protein
MERLRSAKTHLCNLLLDEAGQGTVEYILILSAAVLGGAQLGRVILKSLDKSILRIGSQLEKDLKSGRAPYGVWKN